MHTKTQFKNKDIWTNDTWKLFVVIVFYALFKSSKGDLIMQSIFSWYSLSPNSWKTFPLHTVDLLIKFFWLTRDDLSPERQNVYIPNRITRFFVSYLLSFLGINILFFVVVKLISRIQTLDSFTLLFHLKDKNPIQHEISLWRHCYMWWHWLLKIEMKWKEANTNAYEIFLFWMTKRTQYI